MRRIPRTARKGIEPQGTQRGKAATKSSSVTQNPMIHHSVPLDLAAAFDLELGEGVGEGGVDRG